MFPQNAIAIKIYLQVNFDGYFDTALVTHLTT